MGVRWKRNWEKEGTGEEASGAKEVVITSTEAVFRVVEKKGSGSTPPGVYGNPKKANGKQWGGETGSRRGDAQERATRQHGTEGMK